MRTWEIKYEVREHGAIGIFWPLSDQIEADTLELAEEKFRQEFSKKYELRNPLHRFSVEKQWQLTLIRKARRDLVENSP